METSSWRFGTLIRSISSWVYKWMATKYSEHIVLKVFAEEVLESFISEVFQKFVLEVLESFVSEIFEELALNVIEAFLWELIGDFILEVINKDFIWEIFGRLHPRSFILLYRLGWNCKSFQLTHNGKSIELLRGLGYGELKH
jgi:hypothetical protein